MADSEEVTPSEIDEFKDLYDVAGLTDEEIAIIIGESEGKRGRFDEQRLLGESMRREGHRGGGYDPRNRMVVSGGLLGLGADIFERYRGMKKEEEGIAGLEGMEANDQAQMQLRIERLRDQAQEQQGPMGPPAAVAPPPPQSAPPAGSQISQAPQPQIPSQMPNIPGDQMSIDPLGATSRDIGGPVGTASVGDIPFDQPGWHPPMAPPGGNDPSGGGMGGLSPEELESVQKWLQGLRR